MKVCLQGFDTESEESEVLVIEVADFTGRAVADAFNAYMRETVADARPWTLLHWVGDGQTQQGGIILQEPSLRILFAGVVYRIYSASEDGKSVHVMNG